MTCLHPGRLRLRSASRVLVRSAAALALLLAVASGAPRDVPLGQGPYARMQMTLERTWLGIDVARVEVRFAPETRDRLQQIAQGRPRSAAVVDALARVALDARDASVQLVFLRDVSLDRFVGEVRKSLGRARDAGIIDQATYATSIQRVPETFAPLARRGFRRGDRIDYRVAPGGLRSVVVARTGQVLVDVTVADPRARVALLAGYFAPGSAFREPLIQSLPRG
jgi:hypothetical protein